MFSLCIGCMYSQSSPWGKAGHCWCWRQAGVWDPRLWPCGAAHPGTTACNALHPSASQPWSGPLAAPWKHKESHNSHKHTYTWCPASQLAFMFFLTPAHGCWSQRQTPQCHCPVAHLSTLSSLLLQTLSSCLRAVRKYRIIDMKIIVYPEVQQIQLRRLVKQTKDETYH